MGLDRGDGIAAASGRVVRGIVERCIGKVMHVTTATRREQDSQHHGRAQHATTVANRAGDVEVCRAAYLSMFWQACSDR